MGDLTFWAWSIITYCFHVSVSIRRIESTKEVEVHHVEHLMEANQRVVALEDELKVAA